MRTLPENFHGSYQRNHLYLILLVVFLQHPVLNVRLHHLKNHDDLINVHLVKGTRGHSEDFFVAVVELVEGEVGVLEGVEGRIGDLWLLECG